MKFQKGILFFAEVGPSGRARLPGPGGASSHPVPAKSIIPLLKLKKKTVFKIRTKYIRLYININ